jgi:uncharacterized protein (DUF1800 family)
MYKRNRVKYIYSTLAYIFVIVLLLNPSDDADARRRKKRPKPVPKPQGIAIAEGSTFNVNVTISRERLIKPKKRGKKKKKIIESVIVPVACLDRSPGYLSADKKTFFSYAEEIAYIAKLRGRQKRQSRKKLKEFNQLIKEAKDKCVEPEFLSCDAYDGSFGQREAYTLFERFAFGASAERINRAVASGLEATIQDLTNFKDESFLDAQEQDLRCDTYLAGEEQDKPGDCDPNNINDLERDGVRLGIYHRILNSPNPFMHKLFMFLHDERMAVSSQASNNEEKYAVVRHVEMLRKAARTGDYITFMREWNEDLLGHLKWLDGASNKGTSPNENYAREFWELGTTGPTDLNGRPVYSDIDLQQSSFAFSGWTIQRDEELDSQGKPYYLNIKAFSPDRQAKGPFTIFAGSNFEAKVYNSEDVLKATFSHPRTAEHLAEDIWKEFINPYPTANSIKCLARDIRSNNYNLLPVMRNVMRSKALYSNRSYKSLIKHPMELVFGFFNVFPNYPIRYARSRLWGIDSLLSELGQRPLLPDTVFGWDVDKLAGEAFILPWRNIVSGLLEVNRKQFQEEEYPFFESLMGGLNNSTDAINRFSSWLNVELNDTQRTQLEIFMNNHRWKCQSYHNNSTCKSGGLFFTERELYDPSPLNNNDVSNLQKTLGLFAILLTTEGYRLK